MNILILYLIISFCMWIYLTKINKNFFPDLKNSLMSFIDSIVKKMSPFNDTNILLMKMNLYLITFNKNLDLYNKIYNSNKFSFFNNTITSNTLQFSDISSLIPSSLPITEDIVRSQLKNTISDNNSLLTQFFKQLSGNGCYLLDYWNLLYDLCKPLMIITTNIYTKEIKLNELNKSPWDDNPIDIVLYTQIENNISKIIPVIIQTILILSNITIKYKDVVDLNIKLSNNEITITKYTTDYNAAITKIKESKTALDAYLTKTDYEFTFVKQYIDNIFDIDDFISKQNNTNYIILYRMFYNMDIFTVYSSDNLSNILSSAGSLSI